MLIFLLSAGLGSLGAVIWRVPWGKRERQECLSFFAWRSLLQRETNTYRPSCKRDPLPTVTGGENMQLLNDLKLTGPNGFNHRGALQGVKQSQLQQEMYLKSSLG